jgi:hypothetical protein
MSTPPDDQRQDYDDGPTPPREQPVNPLSLRPTRRGWMTVSVGIIVLILLVWGGYWYSENYGMRHAALRIHSANNLKQIGLAIHNYDEAHGHLPNNTYAPDGTPLLSWRVHILPYMEYEVLYKKFKLDEPWDGPNNLPLIREIPTPYARPGEAYGRGTLTYYRGFSNAGAVFERRPSGQFISWDSIKDGASNTIFVVEAGEAVEWTRPDDLDASPDKPFPRMGGLKLRGRIFGAFMGDGGVRHFKLDFPEPTLRALITYNGGEDVSPD